VLATGAAGVSSSRTLLRRSFSCPVPPTPDPDRLTAVELLIGAPILVGPGRRCSRPSPRLPYLDVALLSAAATFVLGLVARLKVWLLGLALWLALIFGVLHLAGVDFGFVVDPVSRLAPSRKSCLRRIGMTPTTLTSDRRFDARAVTTARQTTAVADPRKDSILAQTPCCPAPPL
jgi:hypothetical protein